MSNTSIRISAIVLLTALSFKVAAQKNVFLDQAFWKTNPTPTQIKAEIAKGNNPAELNPASFDGVVLAINGQAATESIKFLQSLPGNDVNKITHDGRTYIFWAANRGNDELLAYFLQKGAKTDILDSHGSSVVNFAASGGQQNTKVYDVLINNGIDLKKQLNQDGANPLLLAIPSVKDFTLIDYFVSKGIDLKSTDKNGNTAFNYAAKTGNIELLKDLLKKGVKFNNNAMIMASQGSRNAANGLAVYQYLESLKISPTAVGINGENVLHNIVKKPNQEEIINYFIAKGVDVNQADKDGNTPFLNAAASNNNIELLATLSTKVKDINLVNKKGESALSMAVKSNSPEVVALLLAKGAKLSVVDANGDNLMAYLIQSYNSQNAAAFEAKLKMLQDKGLVATAPQRNGNTLYHLALAKNDFTLLKRIADLKVDVNSKNKEGLTPLHKAAMTAKDDRFLKYLITIGAKKEVLTDFEETAFDLAGENEYLAKQKVSIEFLK